MREIEFRAKTMPQLLGVIDGVQQLTKSEWVYGYYAPTYLFEKDGEIKNTYCIISDKFIGQQEMMGCGVNSGLPMVYDIMQDTLGQYTGLKDKNGKKIFEGDIIKYTNNQIGVYEIGRKLIGLIVFDEYNQCYMSRNNFQKDMNWQYADDIEVIGNIHDKSELLKAEFTEEKENKK